MSTNDTVHPIEDDAYKGVYRGLGTALPKPSGPAHLPDRFDLAEILKQTREARGMTLEEVSDLTRVRRNYLEALEQAAYDVLPPRAFAIGYVKAYARFLGLDEETLADMYKRDVTEPQVRLHAPSGASLEDVKPNYRLYITSALCLVAAIVIWNVFQYKPVILRSKAAQDQIANQKWSIGIPLIRDGVLVLTQPAPAPPDQDIPAPYVTPGLEDGFASVAAQNNSASSAPVPVTDILQMRKAFNPQGAIYGAQPENSSVTIQATKSVNLIVHSPDNIVYFAHQLGAGEAYRLPQVGQDNVVLDVSDFKAFDVFYNGEYAGGMDALLTPIGKLNAKAAAMSAVLDQRQAQAGQIVGVSVKVPPKIDAPIAAPRPTEPIPYMPVVKHVETAPPGSASAPESPTPAAVSASASSSAPKIESPPMPADPGQP